MLEHFADHLRCPLDFTRESRLIRESQRLLCHECKLAFPLKLGTPVLLAEEAELPEGIASIAMLPCQRAQR